MGMASSFDKVFGMTPRILIAILTGYIVSSTINSFIMSKMKLAFKGERFKTRAFLSSICGRFWDFSLYYAIAYGGVLDMKTILSLGALPCIVGLVMETLMLPVTSRVVTYVKQREGIDVYDDHVNYNPFSLEV